MVLSPRAKMTLGACIAVLLAGILGLAWWLWRHGRNRAPPTARLRRTRAVLVALGLLVIAVGASWRLVIAFKPVPECSPPGGPLPATPVTAWVMAQKVATWAETGIGLLYSQATGADVCFFTRAELLRRVNANHIAGPVLGPAQLVVLSALGAIIVAAPFVVRYRRAAAGPRGQR